MATTASFKQQCPSCEAMVPIRDPNLIGRKIDCPKCKYRFVVEDPGISADEDDDPKASKPGRDNGKGAKAKAGVRRRDEDDEDEEEAGAKKSGGNNKLVLGIGLSVVAVGLLAVVGYLLFAGGDSSSGKSSSGSSSTSAPAANRGKEENEAPKDEKKEEPAAAGSSVSEEFLTNLLPPDVQGACTVRMQGLIKTTLGRAIFDSPGSFRSDGLERRLGFSVDDVDVIVQGWNFSDNWSLNIIHSTKPFELEKIQAVLHAKPVEEKDRIEGQEYFLLDSNPWLDMLGQATFAMLVQSSPAMLPPRPGPRALRVYDAQTLVFADTKPMQLFLSKKGVFDKKSPEAAPSGDAKPKEAPEDAPPGMGGMRMRMGGAPGMGGNPMMQGNQPKPEEPPAPSGAYLTIEPALKTMLDRVEAKKPVLSLALDTLAAQHGRVPVLGVNPLNMATLFQEANIIGAALSLKDGVTLTLGASYKSEDDAAKHLKSVQKQEGPDLATLLSKAMEIKVEFTEEDPEQAALQAGEGGMPGMRGGMPMGMPGMGVGPPAMNAAKPQMGMGAGQPGGGMTMPPTRRGPPMGGRGGDMGEGTMGMGGPGMGMRMGMGMGQPGTETKKDETPSSTVLLTAPDKSMVLITIHLIDKAANSKLLNGRIRQLVMQQKGNMDMAGGQLRIHELAVAMRSYPETASHLGVFPRGTAERTIPTTRDGRPYPPNERLSWMVELLPYLGPEQQALYPFIDKQKSWHDADNLPAASVLVPQFLDPSYPQSSWWAKAPGGETVAGTHFVGIAGIGLDAGEYSDGDPTVANKLGIFGYDRSMRLTDITDKTSNTILLAQVPPTYKRPWMAGGGSNVVGVPETGSIRPFVSTSRDGKRGTNVVMADGSVRFISENVSDDVFKALCTAKGGEPVFINRDAPLVPPPEGQPELKVVQPQILTAPPKPPKPVETIKENEESDDKVVVIFKQHCMKCHTGRNAKGPRGGSPFVLFTSPGKLNPNVEKARILEVLENGTMPPNNPMNSRPQAQEIAALQKWAGGKH